MRKRHLIIIAFTTCFMAISIPEWIAHAQQDCCEWGMSREEVIRRYASKYDEFTPVTKPQYKNKIMNYILAIDRDLKPKITIIRSSQPITREYLLIENKLYSVLERHGTVTPQKKDDMVKMLTAKFDTPSVQRDKQITVYSFKGAHTKALLIFFHDNPSESRCIVYFYATKLFKMLISR